MIAIAFFLFAPIPSLPRVNNIEAVGSPVTHPALVEVPKGPIGITLYNEKGEVVARCGKKGDTFQGCKMESGVTLDDLMNAWVHAYLEVQK